MELTELEIKNRIVIEVWHPDALLRKNDNGILTKTYSDGTVVRGKIIAVERLTDDDIAVKVDYSHD